MSDRRSKSARGRGATDAAPRPPADPRAAPAVADAFGAAVMARTAARVVAITGTLLDSYASTKSLKKLALAAARPGPPGDEARAALRADAALRGDADPFPDPNKAYALACARSVSAARTAAGYKWGQSGAAQALAVPPSPPPLAVPPPALAVPPSPPPPPPRTRSRSRSPPPSVVPSAASEAPVERGDEVEMKG